MEIHWRNLVFVLCLAVVHCIGNNSNINSNKQQETALSSEFDCNGKIGFYADVEKNCSMFYYCQWDSAKITLSCPENTWFNQKHLQCEGGERKQCLKSKKYFHDRKKLVYGLERLKQDFPKEKRERRSKRQALYIPPSGINTFVVRYFVPTGAASVREQDTFGSNAAIYLPEHYRIAVNPDTESAIHLTRPDTSKEQYTKTKIHYLEKPTDSSTKSPYGNNLQDSITKPYIHSTHKPETIGQPDADRVIHPLNVPDYERKTQDSQKIGNNYNVGRNPQDSSISNYHHSQYSVPSRDESTFIHHPRKAGHKLYHPNEFPSPAQYQRPPPDYDYGDTSYNPSQPRHIHRYPGNMYEEDDEEEDYFYHRPRNNYGSNGYSYPLDTPPYPAARPYQDYSTARPYQDYSTARPYPDYLISRPYQDYAKPKPPDSEELRYVGGNINHYRNTGNSNVPSKTIYENGQRDREHDRNKQRENSNKDVIPLNQQHKERPKDSATHIQDSRSNYEKLQRPGAYGEGKPDLFRESDKRYKDLPYIRYLNEDDVTHEFDNAKPSKEQLKHNGREHDPSQEKQNVNFYQQGNANNNPVSIDAIQEQSNDELGNDRIREDERIYITEKLPDKRRPFIGYSNYEDSYAGRERNKDSEEPVSVQPFIDRKPVEKVTNEQHEEHLPVTSTDKIPLRNENHPSISEVSLKKTRPSDQPKIKLSSHPEVFAYPTFKESHEENNHHVLLTEMQPAEGLSNQFSIHDTHTALKESFPAKAEREYNANNNQKQSTRENLPKNKKISQTDRVHSFKHSGNKYPNINDKGENVNKGTYLKAKNHDVNSRPSAGDKIFAGNIHYNNNNNNAKSNTKLITNTGQKKEIYTTTELPTTTFSLFGGEKFGDRIVKSTSESAESKESVDKEKYYTTVTPESLPVEFYHSNPVSGRTTILSEGRMKDTTDDDKATKIYSVTLPYVRYKQMPNKERQVDQIALIHVSTNRNLTNSDKDTIVSNAGVSHKVKEKNEYRAGHQNHKQESGFRQNDFAIHNQGIILQDQSDTLDTHRKVLENHEKHVPQTENANHRNHRPNLSFIHGKKSAILHKDKSIIGRHHDLQYSEPNLPAAQDRVPAYVTVTPPVTNSELSVTQPFTLIDAKSVTAATYPLEYDAQVTTVSPTETSTIRIRKQKRRRKKGRRRRPKRPRLQITREQTSKEQTHTEKYLSTEAIGITVPTISSQSHYSKDAKIITAEKAESREVVTEPMTTAQPDTTLHQNKNDERTNPGNEGPVERARKRQVRYRNRKRKFNRSRTRTTTAITPAETEKSSPEESFTFQSVDDVTTSQPVTPYRATRTRAMKQKSRTRPRLFGFGKPKPSDDNSNTITTTSSPTS